MAWATLDEARRWWPESGTVADAVLADLLDASTSRLAPYAAPHVDPPLVPLRMANVYDARDLYAGRLVTGTGGELGVDAYTLRLSRGPSQQVRELLRPTRPGVFR